MHDFIPYAPRPGCFATRKRRYALYRRVGGSRGLSRFTRKISPPHAYHEHSCALPHKMYFDCYVYVFLLLCVFCSVYSVFIVPTGILRLPRLRFFHAFSSLVRQMPGYNSQRRGTARTLQIIVIVLFCLVLVLCRSVCFVFVQMCTVLLPPGGYPIAVNKCILSTYRKMLHWAEIQDQANRNAV